MIIEKNALYQSLQSAFSTHHKRFPWPKRHDLEDQTEAFQAAFSQFSKETNEMVRSEIIEQRKIEVDHYRKQLDIANRKLYHARKWKTLYFFTVGICAGAFALGYLVGMFA